MQQLHWTPALPDWGPRDLQETAAGSRPCLRQHQLLIATYSRPVWGCTALKGSLGLHSFSCSRAAAAHNVLANQHTLQSNTQQQACAWCALQSALRCTKQVGTAQQPGHSHCHLSPWPLVLSY